MSQPHALYRTEDDIAIITLNTPEARNALSSETVRLVRQFIGDAQSDEAIKALVITGEGKAFCGGGNVQDFADGKLIGWDFKRFLWDELHRIVLALEDFDKPVIAAVNGPAMGAGMDLALMCDMRVCSQNAKFAESYINMGIIAGDGGAYFLPRLVGMGKALELLLTGDVLDAQEALSLGIANKVVPHEQLMDETLALTRKITAKPMLAVRMMKRAVHQAQISTLRDHMDYVSSQNSLLSETEDHMEAAKAFLEKRKPVFKGK